MVAKLISLDPRTPRLRIALDRLPAIVGRSPDGDIHLDDRWASRIHCEIGKIGGTLAVRDLESRNGTLVNGEYVTEAHLLPGDRLTVGLSSFEVQYKRRKNGELAGAEAETSGES
jgi:pSer/pThr/pTyr-binding forkhead associated (FHA) protein